MAKQRVEQPLAPPPPPPPPTVPIASTVPVAVVPLGGPRRKKWPWIVAAVAVLAAAGVGAALVLVNDDTESATDTTDAVDSSSAPQQTDATETTGIASSTEPASTEASPPAAVTVVVPVATAAPTIATLPPPTIATLPPAPATTVAPTPAPTIPANSGVVAGDLGIAGHPMTKPACDEQFITVVSNAVLPDTYEQAVHDALDVYPGSSYLRTDQTCSSLRPSLNGNPIYMIYFGPYFSMSDACDSRSLGPKDAYVRRLSTTYPPEHIVDCP
jgi:hypothetical protein